MGFIYTRYADDIIVSSMQPIPKEIENHINEVLIKYFKGKLVLNSLKSRYSHKGQRVKILGAILQPNGLVTVDKKQKEEIEILLHFYKEDQAKFKDFLGKDLDKGYARISGILNYIKVLDESYLQKLIKRYGITVVDTLLRKNSEK